MKKLWKKALIFCLILGFCSQSLMAQSTEVQNTDSIITSTTPQWVKDLRDTEIITFGSLPFVTLGVSIGYSIYVLAKNNFDSTYFVNPFAASDSYSSSEQVGILVASSCISVGIGLTNLAINLVKRGIEKKQNQTILEQNIKIVEIENQLNIAPIPKKYLKEKNYIYGLMNNAVF